MNKAELKKILKKEKEKYSNESYEELSKIVEPIVSESGSKDERYQVEVQVLEKNAQYIHVAVAVDDGKFFRTISPLSDSFIVYKENQ